MGDEVKRESGEEDASDNVSNDEEDEESRSNIMEDKEMRRPLTSDLGRLDPKGDLFD